MITIDLGNIANEIAADALEFVKAQVTDLTNDIFVDLTASPPLGTPFDTGFARNAWQIDDANPLAPEIYNTAPYIGRLNDGYSKQSPEGFVDAIVDKHTAK